MSEWGKIKLKLGYTARYARPQGSSSLPVEGNRSTSATQAKRDFRVGRFLLSFQWHPITNQLEIALLYCLFFGKLLKECGSRE